jgi:hypothetical protein
MQYIMSYNPFLYSLGVMVSITLIGIEKNTTIQKKEISILVFKVINNLEFKYKFPLIIYIPILLPFNLLLISLKQIFGNNVYRNIVSLFYSLPINKKVFRLIKTLSLLVYFSTNTKG